MAYVTYSMYKRRLFGKIQSRKIVGGQLSENFCFEENINLLLTRILHRRPTVRAFNKLQKCSLLNNIKRLIEALLVLAFYSNRLIFFPNETFRFKVP